MITTLYVLLALVLMYLYSGVVLVYSLGLKEFMQVVGEEADERYGDGPRHRKMMFMVGAFVFNVFTWPSLFKFIIAWKRDHK